MQRLSFAAAAVIGLLAAISPAFAEGGKMPRIISLSGHGEVRATPDIAYVTSGVVTQGATAAEALAANTKATDQAAGDGTLVERGGKVSEVLVEDVDVWRKDWATVLVHRIGEAVVDLLLQLRLKPTLPCGLPKVTEQLVKHHLVRLMLVWCADERGVDGIRSSLLAATKDHLGSAGSLDAPHSLCCTVLGLSQLQAREAGATEEATTDLSAVRLGDDQWTAFDAAKRL